ncbi:MAG: hypothetical protein ACI4T3_05095, partial [Lactobacillus sp.]
VKCKVLTLKPGCNIECSSCHSYLVKDGFTRYKRPCPFLNQGNKPEFENCHLQRLTCPNKNCPAKTKSGNNVTHVLLTDNSVPRYSEALEYVETAHLLDHLIKDYYKNQLHKPSKISYKIIIDILKNSYKEKLKTLILKYNDACLQWIIREFVLSVRGKRLLNYVELIYQNASALAKSHDIQCSNCKYPKTISLQSIEQKISNFSGWLSNIFLINCSRFVRTLSKFPKYSLRRIALTIGTSQKTCSS